MKKIMDQKLWTVEQNSISFGAENGEDPFWNYLESTMQHIIDVDSTSVSIFVVILFGKYSICQLNQNNYKYWDGNAVYIDAN